MTSAPPQAPPAAPARSRTWFERRQAWTSSPLFATVVIVLVIGTAWQVASLHRLVASPPTAVHRIWVGFVDGDLTEHLVWTMQNTITGFAVGATVGIGLGLAIGFWRSLYALFAEIVYGLASIPKLILFPIIIVLLGIGRASEVTFVAIATVYLVLISTMVGVREVKPIYVKVSQVCGATGSFMARKVLLPAIAPHLLTGLRLGFSMALVHAVLGEMSLGNHGLGDLIWLSFSRLDMPTLYGVVLLVAVLAVAGNMLLWIVQRRLAGPPTSIEVRQ